MPGASKNIFSKGFAFRLMVILTLLFFLFTVTAYSVSLNVRAEPIVLGERAVYAFQTSILSRVLAADLSFSGDNVNGAEVTIDPEISSGICIVRVRFSNGVSSTRGIGFAIVWGGFPITVSVNLSPINYYPNPQVSAWSRCIGLSPPILLNGSAPIEWMGGELP